MDSTEKLLKSGHLMLVRLVLGLRAEVAGLMEATEVVGLMEAEEVAEVADMTVVEGEGTNLK